MMSGTSLDGVDAALIETDGVTVAATGPWRTAPYPADLREQLRAVIEGRGERAAAEHALTQFHADVAEALLAEAGLRREEVAITGFPGHTVRHEPDAGRTDQIGDGAALARRLRIDVVNDFRSADVAAGGQGAPLAPLYHAALARRSGLATPLAVLNIGGVANLTWIGGRGDADSDRLRHRPRLRADRRPCQAQHRARRSTGTAGWRSRAGWTGRRWMPSWRIPISRARRRNRSTATPSTRRRSRHWHRATARRRWWRSRRKPRVSRAPHMPARPRRWLVTGGGRHNPALMAELNARLGVPCDPVEGVGWQGDALEAQAFGFLAVRSLRGLPLSLPGTTGVPHPQGGGVLHPAPRPGKG